MSKLKKQNLMNHFTAIGFPKGVQYCCGNIIFQRNSKAKLMIYC